MRSALAVLFALVLVGCRGTASCKDGTIFLTVSLTGTSMDADDLGLLVTSGSDMMRASVNHTPGVPTGSVEIDFPAGYPAGQTVDVQVSALQGGYIIGEGEDSVALTASCASLALLIGPVLDLGPDAADLGAPTDLLLPPRDLAVPDLSSPDLAVADLSIPPDDFACGAMADLDGIDFGPSCPSVAACAIHYVDPVAGTDDSQHGGASGSCAFRTVSYALGHASGQIALADATYPSAGDTLPFVLTGAQQLSCTPSQLGTIQGSGMYNGKLVTVVFAGQQNGLSGCTLDGKGLADYLLEVAGAGAGSGHLVDQVGFTRWTSDAIHVDPSGSHLRVTGSGFNSGHTGISWPAGGIGSMDTNEFTNTTLDITCGGSDPGVTGSGSSDAQTMSLKPTCTACGACATF